MTKRLVAVGFFHKNPSRSIQITPDTARPEQVRDAGLIPWLDKPRPSGKPWEEIDGDLIRKQTIEGSDRV